MSAYTEYAGSGLPSRLAVATQRRAHVGNLLGGQRVRLEFLPVPRCTVRGKVDPVNRIRRQGVVAQRVAKHLSRDVPGVFDGFRVQVSPTPTFAVGG